jgi:phosphoribosylanthranilate isomerase
MPAPLIKICGITTSETLSAALRAGASHIGLVFFAKSPRSVSIDLAASLANEARGAAKIVGLFVDPDAAYLDAVRAQVHLDVIQLHGNETPAFVSNNKMRHGIEVWKALRIKTSADLDTARKFVGSASRILYDAMPPAGSDLLGGTGLRIDWSILAGAPHPLPWILAGGLTPHNVAEAIRTSGASFVDVSSGVESAPGIKDVDKIAAFCKAAQRT